MVTATPNYFLVAPSYYDREKRMTRSRVLTIPIGDDVGELEVTHEIDVRSRIADKFKFYEKDGVLFVVTQDSLRWNTFLATSIESFDLSAPEITAPLGDVEHRPRASGSTRRVSTATGSTWSPSSSPVRIDPLFVIDIADPGQHAGARGNSRCPVGQTTWSRSPAAAS